MGLTFIMLILLLILAVLVLAETVLMIPKIIVRSAPKDIQEKVLARPDLPKSRTVLGIVLAILLLLAVLALLVWAGADAVQRNWGFGAIFARFLILLDGYKIFDMICFDWILLTKLNIFQRLFPETVGCRGYESFGFNLKSQIIKLIVFTVISFVIALILSRN